MRNDVIRSVEAEVRRVAEGAPRMVLAVSGGLDSMVLLNAASRVARSRVAAVATFDHGTGPHARRGATLVCGEAALRGLPVVVGHARQPLTSEAALREARWRFLRGVARRVRGVVVTAHTEDDQVETVLMRALRGAGARGLAGLYASAAGVVRPFVGLRRDTLERYAVVRELRWVEDPTNASLRYFRNRVRHELLPALLAARPALRAELLALAGHAAELRAAVEEVASAISTTDEGRDSPRAVSVALANLADYDAESLAVLWPAIAARVGLALDRRGTRRVAEFTNSRGRTGASVQLAGGWEVVRDRGHFTLRRARGGPPAPAELPPAGSLRWGRWSFARETKSDRTDAWRAALPEGPPLVVRAWRPGDRMVGAAGRARRVKRFFGDAGIIGPDRVGWPVVLAGEEIVWIPGVGRRFVAVGTSSTPGRVYSCELNDR